jgi:uncharacterized membrane protein YkgB
MKTSLTLTGWWLLWLGFVAYGGINFLLLFGLAAVQLNNVVGAALLIGVTLGLAALCWRFGIAMLGYGLIIGYALVTISSSGTCTYLNTLQGYEYLNGLAVFVITVLAGAVLLIIASVIQGLRNRS